jgi:hypothetical protein
MNLGMHLLILQKNMFLLKYQEAQKIARRNAVNLKAEKMDALKDALNRISLGLLTMEL